MISLLGLDLFQLELFKEDGGGGLGKGCCVEEGGIFPLFLLPGINLSSPPPPTLLPGYEEGNWLCVSLLSRGERLSKEDLFYFYLIFIFITELY